MEELAEEPEAGEMEASEDSDPAARDFVRVDEDEPPLIPPPPSLPEPDVPPDLPGDLEGGASGPADALLGEDGESDVEEEEKEEDDSKGDDDEDPATLWIDKSLLARVNQVFVAPSGYSESLQKLRERILNSHVFILHGEEHAGKLTCALHLAQDLLAQSGKEPRIGCYRRRADESPSLLDLVRQGAVKRDRAYIIEDAFPSLSMEDLDPPFLNRLNERLQDRGSFLLLTTERPAQELPVSVAKVRVAVRDLSRVFLNHLDVYRTDLIGADRIVIDDDALELASQSWETLQGDLKDPDQIDEFCRRLGVQGGVPSAQELQKLAREIALRRIEAARPWFAGLRLHEKLFAFLVVLFPGRDGLSLYEIFLDVVGQLRGHGLRLKDPREIGYDDLLDRIRVVEGPTREIGFQERAIGGEVEWQIKNYNHLLWSLVPWFLEEVQSSLGKQGAETRRSLAVAVGRIGLHHPAQLRARLEELAKHPITDVAAATGYAFSEVCLRNRDADQRVCEVLYEWVASRQSRLMWSASSCIWRVYGALKRSGRDTVKTRERLLDTLADLISMLAEQSPLGDEDRKAAAAIAGGNTRDAKEAKRQTDEILKSWADKNYKAARIAIQRIAAADPEGMIARLRLWLAGSRPALRRMSIVMIRQLFADAAREAGPPRRRHLALAELVEPVLAHCGEGSQTTEALFRALATWAVQSEAPRATKPLLQAANRLQGRAARAFRSGLLPWLEDPSPEVRRLGGALLMRSLLLEGAVVPAPDSALGALVLDASTEALAETGYEPIARRIWHLLQPRLKLRLVRMGEGRELAGPGQLFPARGVLAGASRPRLLLPTFDAMGAESLCLAVVLTTGPILDLAEVSIAAWSSNLLLVDLTKASWEQDLPRAVYLNPHSPAGGLADLAARINDRFASMLAHVGSGAREAECDEIEAKLEQWLGELDEPPSLAEPPDRALAILRGVLGLAESHLDRCSALLTRWLAPNSGELALRMGAAAVRLLLRIEAHRPPPAPPAGALLFGLAAALGTYGPEGSLETALSAICRWLTLAEWYGTLLEGAGDRPAVLRQWIESLPPDRAELLSQTIAAWRRSTDDESDEAAQRLVEAVERIEDWIAADRAEIAAEEEPPSVDPEVAGQLAPVPAVAARTAVDPSFPVADPAGFPMVWIEEIGAYMHWLPVTKLQFEKFVALTPDPFFDDAWYRRALDLNPRVAVPEIDLENYLQAFLTGILPEEASRFAAWCGEDYALPTLADWQKAYAALAAEPACALTTLDPSAAAGELVRRLLTRIESSAAAAARPGRERTRADQMLMRRGLLEWVKQDGRSGYWSGMGEPAPHFKILWSIERGPSVPRDAGFSRSPAFGFRLIRRPA